MRMYILCLWMGRYYARAKAVRKVACKWPPLQQRHAASFITRLWQQRTHLSPPPPRNSTTPFSMRLLL